MDDSDYKITDLTIKSLLHVEKKFFLSLKTIIFIIYNTDWS